MTGDDPERGPVRDPDEFHGPAEQARWVAERAAARRPRRRDNRAQAAGRWAALAAAAIGLVLLLLLAGCTAGGPGPGQRPGAGFVPPPQAFSLRFLPAADLAAELPGRAGHEDSFVLNGQLVGQVTAVWPPDGCTLAHAWLHLTIKREQLAAGRAVDGDPGHRDPRWHGLLVCPAFADFHRPEAR